MHFDRRYQLVIYRIQTVKHRGKNMQSYRYVKYVWHERIKCIYSPVIQFREDDDGSKIYKMGGYEWVGRKAGLKVWPDSKAIEGFGLG